MTNKFSVNPCNISRIPRFPLSVLWNPDPQLDITHLRDHQRGQGGAPVHGPAEDADTGAAHDGSDEGGIGQPRQPVIVGRPWNVS